MAPSPVPAPPKAAAARVLFGEASGMVGMDPVFSDKATAPCGTRAPAAVTGAAGTAPPKPAGAAGSGPPPASPKRKATVSGALDHSSVVSAGAAGPRRSAGSATPGPVSAPATPAGASSPGSPVSAVRIGPESPRKKRPKVPKQNHDAVVLPPFPAAPTDAVAQALVKCSAVRIKELMAADGWRGLRGGKEPQGTKADMDSVLLGQREVERARLELLSSGIHAGSAVPTTVTTHDDVGGAGQCTGDSPCATHPPPLAGPGVAGTSGARGVDGAPGSGSASNSTDGAADPPMPADSAPAGSPGDDSAPADAPTNASVSGSGPAAPMGTTGARPTADLDATHVPASALGAPSVSDGSSPAHPGPASPSADPRAPGPTDPEVHVSGSSPTSARGRRAHPTVPVLGATGGQYASLAGHSAMSGPMAAASSNSSAPHHQRPRNGRGRGGRGGRGGPGGGGGPPNGPPGGGPPNGGPPGGPPADGGGVHPTRAAEARARRFVDAIMLDPEWEDPPATTLLQYVPLGARSFFEADRLRA